jgi:hypothetical protein
VTGGGGQEVPGACAAAWATMVSATSEGASHIAMWPYLGNRDASVP